MARDDDLAQAIRQRDIESIVRLMFEGNPPSLRPGFGTETELWDFKGDCPKLGKEWANAWADLAGEVLAFHNHRGGILVFGIRDDFSFSGATTRLDSKLVNDQLRKFLGDRIWVEFSREFIQPDQRYLGLALIPPRGPTIERFRADAPEIRGSRLFRAGDSAIREGDSTRILPKGQADDLARKLAIPTLGQIYGVNEPFSRILNPEYVQFVDRAVPCKAVEDALRDPRAAIAAVIGIGGVGKTALATWATLKAYDRRDFAFIVSLTAKDRELTSTGIQALEPALTSFEALFDNILEVLGFPEVKAETVDRKEREVRSLLDRSNGLLYVDNLETVDDARIIRFLDTLPVGVRAITTSRRTSVRVSVRPVDLGPLTEDEVVKFVGSLASQPGFTYVSDLSPPERARLGTACDGLPLAIRWALARSKSAGEALAAAESITASGRRGEELLEFCFRRVFDAMPGPEKAVLQVLSLFQRPLPTEAVLVGAGLPHFKLLDATEELVADALVQRLFDPDRNDYCYTLLPVARAFVYAQVVRQPELEKRTRGNLADWFEAKDVKDPGERLVVREVRQGKGASESALVDLAQGAERRGDLLAAQGLYEQALHRNPRSSRAARLFAEFYRHKLQNQTEALRLYEQAAANAPRRGPERARIFREWGMLLRDSGDPEATDLAIEKFETALAETPNDVVAIHALAHMLDRKGGYRRVIALLEPLATHPNPTTRKKTLPILLKAYDLTRETLKAEELRSKLEELEGH